MSRPRLFALLLVVLTLLVYLPVLRCDFVDFDDDDYVTRNPHVKAGLTLAGAAWAFQTYYANNWHPLTWLSHMADCQIFGVNPHAHHLVNALFHAANTALVFVLLFRLTGKIWPSAFIAALFAWHPMHVESVAWIAERKDVLSTFFSLLALLCYVKYARGHDRWEYGQALLFFALALLAKPMAVTLPFVMLLLDFWPLQRFAAKAPAEAPNPAAAKSLPRLIAEKWPFFVLVAASCIVTCLAQSMEFRSDKAMASLDTIPLSERLTNIPVAYAVYLLKLLCPSGLAVFYPLSKSVPAPEVIGAIVLLLLVTFLVWRARASRPVFLVGWLWFLGTLVPVIGIVKAGGAAVADRYTYLPSVGLFLMITSLAVEIIGKVPSAAKWFAAAAAMVLLACIGLTEHQLTFWRNGETLFRRDLAVAPDNAPARINLGIALQEQGKLEEALDQYRRAEALNPAYPITHNNLANLYDLLGHPAESLAEYRLAIQLIPKDASQHVGAGYELGQLGQFAAALQELALAMQLAPRYAAPHETAARIYFKMGRDADGINEFRAALQLRPDDWHLLSETAYYLAANENATYRDGASAMKLAARANILTSGSVASVCDVLGMACAETGDFPDAIESSQHAIELAAAAGQKDLSTFQHRLELYQKHQPWHESFLATNVPPNATR